MTQGVTKWSNWDALRAAQTARRSLSQGTTGGGSYELHHALELARNAGGLGARRRLDFDGLHLLQIVRLSRSGEGIGSLRCFLGSTERSPAIGWDMEHRSIEQELLESSGWSPWLI